MSQLKKEETGSVKAIFINAKDNTMSYILLENRDSYRRGIDEDQVNKYIYSEIGYKSLYSLLDILISRSNTWIYVDDEMSREIRENDFGFVIDADLSGFDLELYYPYVSGYPYKYDGTYDTFIDSNPNRFRGYRFTGNAVIITNDFTLEQLSQMVKCFYMKKIDDPDAVLPLFDSIEHSSHPKIIEMVGDGKDLELGN